MNACFGKYTQFNINCDTKINKYNKEQNIYKDIYIYLYKCNNFFTMKKHFNGT